MHKYVPILKKVNIFVFEKHSVLSFILYHIKYNFKQKYIDYTTSNIVPEKA